MKTADIEIEDMAVAGNVVLKRTSRAIVEYGTEMEASEHSGRKLSNNTKPDEGILPKGESKASTSGVTASAAIAMEVSAKPYSRRGSVSGPPTSTELADTNGVPRGADSKVAVDGIKLADKAQDSPNFAKTGLKPHKLDGLHQDDRPLNFGQVLPGIYRSSFPRTEDYPFYKKLGLKTVV
jgi:tyrosine-protein phosphatase SIW14